MNLTIRRAGERGHANHGWLDTYHSFSFASYYDPQHIGFRSLRVINQDRVAPGRGFATHPHSDMEIFSYVLMGAIAHKDSMGNGRELLPGEIQLMSAGTGVTHSEFNPRDDEELHLLQIWIEPNECGLTPSYTEWKPPPGAEGDKDVIVISPDGRNGSAVIHQDAIVHRLLLAADDEVSHEVSAGRGAWIQLVKGKLTIGDAEMLPGDGASTEDVGRITMHASEPVEALLLDLA
jgi:quercetin 2,3-dioxygenase